MKKTMINADLDVDDEVVNHLLFHKSLIDENEDQSRLNHYMNIVQKTRDGEHVSMDNPFDKSIAVAFELVMQQHINPWDIDLVRFSSLYLKRAKEEQINLVAAGRIIYMAWKVLKMQSHELVNIVEQQESSDDTFYGWDELPCDDWYVSDDRYDYTRLVTQKDETPFREPVRRKSRRKVSLIELVEAFDKARKETEEYQIVSKLREEERELMKQKARKHMDNTVHSEDPEKDVEVIWKRINDFNGKSIPLTKLYENGNREELIRALTSILFLANENKIRVYQRKFPFGKIYVKNIVSN